jgi:hypothetical protein
MKNCNIAAHLVVLGWCLLASASRANPCVYPKRLVSAHIVNLQPLIEWWTEPKGIRPLSDWRHLHGKITRDTDSGWVVLAKNKKDLKSQVLMRNPPRDRLRRFQELKKQLSECERDRNEALAFVRRPVCVDLNSLYTVAWPAPPISAAEYHDGNVRLAKLTKTFDALRSEVGPMQDAQGDFVVDAFALNLHQTFEGLPVFDHGQPQP